MSNLDPASLDDGIRDLVLRLVAAGIRTTDSGDGTKAATMACAVDFPHVFCVTSPETARDDIAICRREVPPDWRVEVQFDDRDGIWCLMTYLPKEPEVLPDYVGVDLVTTAS